MTVVAAQQTLTGISNLAVPLPRYFQLIQITECSGWGVLNPTDSEPGCRDIWTKFQRDEVERYLAEAQEEIEQQIGFTMTPQWQVTENHFYRCPILTDWGKVIAGGVRVESDISLGETVDHTTDPAVIGPVATTVTAEDEIHIFHPGTDVEIIPSSIGISSGNVTIEIPRCRMVLAALADNPEEGIDYTDTMNFEAEVDVKRVYNDPSTNAVIVWPHQCTANCASGGCREFTQAGCIYTRKPLIGSVDVTPANYVGGQWVQATMLCCRGNPQFVRLNYYAGQQVVTRQMEDAVLRLAHSKMPDETICACETFTRLWRRDRFIPEILTRERLNNPFGLSDGAWASWAFTRQFRLVRGDTI